MKKRCRTLIGNPIHLCFITDESYVLPTLVALKSLRANKRPESRYVAHVIGRDISRESVIRLEAASCEDIKVEILQRSALPVDESKVDLVRHVSPAAIFKFFIPEILPNQKRVIYLDSDILIQGDIAELWQTDISDVYAGVVKDNQTITGRDGHLKWLEFKYESYFNSGVMLLNLALMRRDRVTEKLVDYRIHGKNRFMDQDALNVVFGNRVRYVPLKYNCLNWLFIACSILQLKELFGKDQVADTPEATNDKAVVLHIGGSEKPWLCDLPYYTPIYRKYAEEIGWHISFPKVSVIIPVFNAAKYLVKALESVCSQTLKELDIICVDNNSTDASPEILRQFAERDKRIRIFRLERKGAGVCRNFGISHARGEYVGFVDADDIIAPDFYQKLYARIREDDSDVCMTSLVRECDASGKLGKIKSLGDGARTVITCVRDRGELILASGAAWNKIYRRRYLIDNAIRFSEQPCAGEDKLFDFGMLLTANRIAVIADALYCYRQSGSQSESFRRKGRESFAIIDFYLDIKAMLDARPMGQNAKDRWRNIVKRTRDAEFKTFANRMDPKLRLEFIGRCVEAFYDDIGSTRQISNLIVSLTSFPERISTVHRTIKTILGQSVRPEKVILWLAKEQFPGGEVDLPAQLLALKPLGLNVEWYHDIRSYKKLIPALKKYPQYTIVTADDDMLYPRYWLEKLWDTHLEFPDSIIFHRGRSMTTRFSRISPYCKWPILTHNVKRIRYYVLPTGAGGILYPLSALHKEVLNEQEFLSIAPLADDLWFWAMSVMRGTEARQVYAYENRLNYVEGTQDATLALRNVAGGQNDIQLKAILNRYPEIEVILRRERVCELRNKISHFFSSILNLRNNFDVRALSAVRRKCITIKSLRFVVKQFVPYGMMCHWLRKIYGTEIDLPLFYYVNPWKRLRRIVKFMLPYGLVIRYRRKKYGYLGPDVF